MSERDDYQSLMRNNLAYRIKIEANRKEIERLTAENERMKEGIYEIGQISFHPRIMELNEQQLRIKFEDIRARASCLYDKQALGDALKEQVEKLKQELLERGGHTNDCRMRTQDPKGVTAFVLSCTCGWEARREQLDEELKKGGD